MAGVRSAVQTLWDGSHPRRQIPRRAGPIRNLHHQVAGTIDTALTALLPRQRDAHVDDQSCCQ